MAQGLHRVVEVTRKKISKCRSINFIYQKDIFKSTFTYKYFQRNVSQFEFTSTRPQPILTRWGTWLEGAVY